MINLLDTKTANFTDYKKFRAFTKQQEKTKTQKEVQFKDWAVTGTGLKVNGDEYPMRDLAMRQMLKLFGMPQKFYFEKAPTDMAIRDINRMRDEYSDDSEMVVHMQKEEVRGITGPNFVHTPYPSLLTKLPVKENFNTASYSDWGIRATTTDKTDLVKVDKGDIIEVGADIVYSDTGWTPLSGSPFFNRLVCTNGMVCREKTDLIHAFRMRMTHNIQEEVFLRNAREGYDKIAVDGKKIANVFRIMQDHPMDRLDKADQYLGKVRTAVTKEVFEQDEHLVKKIKDGEKEKFIMNLEVPIYLALAQITVLAKTLGFVQRRQLEIHAGALLGMTLAAIKAKRIKAKL